ARFANARDALLGETPGRRQQPRQVPRQEPVTARQSRQVPRQEPVTARQSRQVPRQEPVTARQPRQVPQQKPVRQQSVASGPQPTRWAHLFGPRGDMSREEQQRMELENLRRDSSWVNEAGDNAPYIAGDVFGIPMVLFTPHAPDFVTVAGPRGDSPVFLVLNH